MQGQLGVDMVQKALQGQGHGIAVLVTKATVVELDAQEAVAVGGF